MAIIREYPKCPFCGEVIADAVYKDYKNYPIELIPIGDSFSHWKYKKHKCKKKDIKKIKEKDIFASIKELLK